MQYLAIVGVEDNRVSKYQDFDTEKEALTHIDAFFTVEPSEDGEEPPAPEFGGIVYDNVKGHPIDHLWVDGETVEVKLPDLASDEVNQERDRRISSFSFDGKEYDFDEISKVRIFALGAVAHLSLLKKGTIKDKTAKEEPQQFVWIAKDNTQTTMDAQKVLEFAVAAATHESGHILSARSIKDAGKIPHDFKDDKYWPQKGD